VVNPTTIYSQLVYTFTQRINGNLLRHYYQHCHHVAGWRRWSLFTWKRQKAKAKAEAKEAKAQSESTEVSTAEEMQDVYQQLIAKGWRNITIHQCSCRSNQC
jgi:hypothetical protein